MRHFNLKGSAELMFKPGVRLIQPVDHENQILKQGKKYIEPKYTEPIVYEHKFITKGCSTNEHVPSTRRHFIIRDNPPRYELEDVMGQKGRIPSLEAQRNSFPIINPGDKIFKNPDYSPDFFKGGGLIPGSTNKIRYNKNSGKKSNLFYESLDLNAVKLDKNKIWNNKCLQESLDFDKNYVFNYLKVWEKDVLQLPKAPKFEAPAKNTSPGKKK
jgi:hypothetical protein